MAKPFEVEEILQKIRRDFYRNKQDQEFFRDRQALVYTLTWPAQWLKDRALNISGQRYRKFILERLAEIKQHGRFELSRQYFPAYLSRCLKTWFDHHGEDLYDELKHARNSIDKVMKKVGRSKAQAPDNTIEILAQAHQLTHPTRKRKPKKDTDQLTLF